MTNDLLGLCNIEIYDGPLKIHRLLWSALEAMCTKYEVDRIDNFGQNVQTPTDAILYLSDLDI